MTRIELPDDDLLPVTLEPHTRVVLGGGEAAGPQHGRLSLGRPVCVPLDPARVDDDAKDFLSGRPGSRFFLLALTSSFAADDENPLESAWVDVALQQVAPPEAAAPVAWSMTPLSAADAVNVSRTVTLGSSLKFALPLLPAVEAGPSAERVTEQSYARRDVAVEALHEGTSTPTWRFFPTQASQIRGVHRLQLVVEMTSGTTGRAEVRVGATIRLRRFKVLRYTANLTDVPEAASTALPPV